MLEDRKVLLEKEIARLHIEAANMYLSIVISGDDHTNPAYQALKERISDLTFDLNIVNEILARD